MKKIFLVLVMSLNLLGVGVSAVQAAGEVPPSIGIEHDLLPGSPDEEDIYLTNKDRTEKLQSEVIGRIVQTMTSMISAIAVLMIVIAGYLYLTARGNEDQIKKAHKTVTFAIIALFVMMFAYSAVSIIAHLTSLL